jgi:hypothetical protein
MPRAGHYGAANTSPLNNAPLFARPNLPLAHAEFIDVPIDYNRFDRRFAGARTR